MNEEIKSLLKIIGICFVVEIGLILIIIASLFSFQVYKCHETGGVWIFNKVDEKICTDLGIENCKDNPNCVLYSTTLDNLIPVGCKPKSGCNCPEESNSWYSFRGCS